MFDDIFLLLLAVAFIVVAILLFVVQPIKLHRDNKKQIEELDDEASEPESEPVLASAEIIGKRIDEGYSGGSKAPQYKTEFVLVFKTEEGETKEFWVERELYDRVSVGQKGNLITINGNFFDFGDGEEMPAEDTTQ